MVRALRGRWARSSSSTIDRPEVANAAIDRPTAGVSCRTAFRRFDADAALLVGGADRRRRHILRRRRSESDAARIVARETE
jgi:hypothetical protein